MKSTSELLAEAETAIRDLLLEIYARDTAFNDQAMQYHNLLVDITRHNKKGKKPLDTAVH